MDDGTWMFGFTVFGVHIPSEETIHLVHDNMIYK